LIFIRSQDIQAMKARCILNNCELPYTFFFFCRYVTNIPDEMTREQLKEVFPSATQISNPRRHNPKLKSPTKYAFVSFDEASEALEAFRTSYNKQVGSGDDKICLILRYRRVSFQEINKTNLEIAQKAKAAEAEKSKGKQLKNKLKEEIASDEESGDDEVSFKKFSDCLGTSLLFIKFSL